MEWPVNGHRGRPDASPNQAKTSAKNVADRLLEPSLAKSAQTADGVSAAWLVDQPISHRFVVADAEGERADGGAGVVLLLGRED